MLEKSLLCVSCASLLKSILGILFEFAVEDASVLELDFVSEGVVLEDSAGFVPGIFHPEPSRISSIVDVSRFWSGLIHEFPLRISCIVDVSNVS